jgi:uncharacterized membrane protein
MSKKKKVSTSIKQIFLSGFLAILPIGVTVWIILKAIELGEFFLGGYIRKITPTQIPALGLIATIILIFFIGLFVHGYIGKFIRKWIEGLFSRTPIIKSIYKPIRDIVENFASPNNDNFKKVVLVSYPNENTKSIGFVTKSNVIIDESNLTAVFIPTTPNPTNGFLVYYKKEDMMELDIPVDEALKVVISLGTTTPNPLQKKQNSMNQL